MGCIIDNRHMISVMARREFMARYVGTFGGILWAIAHPVAMLIIFWFVFSVGLKAQGPANTPFILYFVCGLVPWLTFNEVLSIGTNGVTSNANLVKKTVFPSEILPLVYIVSASASHLVLLLLTFILLTANGIPITIYSAQVLYYFTALCIFLLGICWLSSALNVFHRDIGQVIALLLNLWFWATPIVWTGDLIPEKYRWLLHLNPLEYVIEGYRKSLLYHEAAWSDMTGAGSYWTLVGIVFVMGAYIFRRLKPDFADVL